MNSIGQTRYLIAVLLALAAHLWVLTRPLPSALKTDAEKRAAIEVERAGDLEFVQTHRALKQNPVKDRAKYAGEFDQRVDKQTVSPNRGLLSRGGASGDRSAERPSLAEREEPGRDAELALPGGGPRLRDLLTLSASPQDLKEFARGDETIVNTDSVSYASFLRRVADEIYQSWEHYATVELTRMQLEGRHLGANLYTTRLWITMNDDGRVVAIQTLKSSGIPQFDEAPQKAIWEQDSFPNPPEQMRQPDGAIRFVYEFTIDYKTSSFSILPWAI